MTSVVSESLEYRNGQGKVLSCGDRLKVDGLRGRWEMRRHVVRETHEYIEAMGHGKRTYGKVYRFDPADCHRRGGDQAPSKYVRKWRDRWQRRQGLDVDDSPADDPVPAGHERLGPCKRCGSRWVREVKRGRKPKTCPTCK